jgi:hypothetical protein
MSAKALLLLGAAALLPPLSGQVTAQPGDSVARPFAPTEAPLVLTRKVWRTLGDGKEIVVTRRYAVQFARRGDGYLLDGRLIDAAVEAPPVLAALAELERNRPEAGLFPVLLDGAGRIREVAGTQQDQPTPRESARNKAEEIITSAPMAAAQKQEAGAFLKQLAAQGVLAAWPADLFNPVPGERHEHRRIALPSGQEGEVDVSLKVEGALSSGLPRLVERTVTTVLAGTSRTSRERWTLGPVALPQR